jgi:hypothetical protein
MKHFYSLLFLLIPGLAFSQLTVVSTNPQNNATNVPINVMLAITFSAPVDTIQFENNHSGFHNFDAMGEDYFSADAKTLYTPLSLSANHAYFFSLYSTKGKDGSTLQSPYVGYFTTGASFPTLTVSGTVSAGNSGVSVANSIVGLSTIPAGNSEPKFAAWANVNANGTYTVPYVTAGKYWPVAAKDVNNDGSIDPGQGIDVAAFGDSIIVDNAPLTNVNLSFKAFKPYLMSEALPIADSLAKTLPSDRSLRAIRADRADTSGRSTEWSFYYAINNNTAAMRIIVRPTESRIETADDGYVSSIIASRPLANPQLAAASSLVMANAETNGGKVFRQQAHPDSMILQIQMLLGDLSRSEYWMLSPDANLYYWGVMYSYGVEQPNNWTSYRNNSFLCDLSTGTVLRTTPVNELDAQLPASFALEQNFPNPFNPTTSIEYQIPERSFVKLEIIDMLGRRAALLVSEVQSAGRKSVQWNASGMASGMYVCKLTAGAFVDAKKMMLLK